MSSQNVLQVEKVQLPHPVFIEEIIPLDHFSGPPLDPLQQLCVSPVLRTPHLDILLQVRSHQHRVEGQDYLPCPAAFGAAQDTVGFLGYEDTLLACVQLPSTTTPKSCLAGLCAILTSPSLY